MEDWPLFRFRMERARPGPRSTRLMEEDPGYLDAVFDEVREHGPLTASDLSDPGERAGPWWGWSKGKVALEWLFTTGRVTVANRRNFTRHYDVPERVVPAEILRRSPVPERDAIPLLVERAARALGVATAADLADYFRIRVADAAKAAAALAVDGTLEAVEVEGWAGTSYRHPAVSVPRETAARALVCPFDPIVWFRPRTERLFGFHYRIEIYSPEPKRQFGYYVFPLLVGDRLVGRVDVKADRPAGILRVPGAFVEEGEDPAAVAVPLAAELREMAGWLGLGDFAVGRKGTLTTPLRRLL